jgi:hypothetical protein
MADQRITDLVELPQGGVASNDVLPISDVSANQTKKIQVKALIQAGFDLADASTLDISKINQASAAKLGADAFGANVITYDKIQQVSNTDRLLGRSSADAGNIEEIICTSFARSLLDDADAATARSSSAGCLWVAKPQATPAARTTSSWSKRSSKDMSGDGGMAASDEGTL